VVIPLTSALYPVLGQPPHLAHILTVVHALKEFDAVTLCVMDKDAIIKASYAKQLFEKVFDYTDAVDVILDKSNFDEDVILPHQFEKYDTILVTDNYRYAHLLSYGVEKVKMMPRLIGINDAFFMKAFHQSMALDRLNMNMTIKPIKNRRKT